MTYGQQLRVLFASRVFSPGSLHGGAQTDQMILGTTLAELGCDVEVLTSDIHERRRGRPQRNGGVVATADNHGPITVQRIPARWQYHWDGLLRDPRATLIDQARRSSIVQVFGVRHHLEWVIHSARASFKAPIFVFPLGEIPPKGNLVWFKRAFDAAAERRRLQNAAGVIAVSEREEKELLQWGLPRDKTFRLPGFGELLPAPTMVRDAVRKRLGIPEKDLVLVWAGRFDRIKGLDLLLDAISKDPALAHIHLCFAGDGGHPGERERVEHISRHVMPGRTHFLGWLESQERADVYAASDAFVLPSKYESFSRAAAEAVIAGLPLLVSDTCGFIEQTKPATITFERTAQSVATALRRFGSDPDLRTRLRSGAEGLKADLGPQRAARYLMKLYGSALDSKDHGVDPRKLSDRRSLDDGNS